MKTLAQRPAPVQTPRTNYIFSKTAATQILGRKDVANIEVWDHMVKIDFLSGSPRIASKKPFLKYFAESRKQRAIALPVEKISGALYEVKSSRVQNKKYLVEISLENWVNPRMSCPCSDYRTQVEVGINTPCCKHIYAVLGQLGFSSYFAWIENEEF